MSVLLVLAAAGRVHAADYVAGIVVDVSPEKRTLIVQPATGDPVKLTVPPAPAVPEKPPKYIDKAFTNLNKAVRRGATVYVLVAYDAKSDNLASRIDIGTLATGKLAVKDAILSVGDKQASIPQTCIIGVGGVYSPYGVYVGQKKLLPAEGRALLMVGRDKKLIALFVGD